MAGTPTTMGPRSSIRLSKADQVVSSEKTVTVTVGELRSSFKGIEAKLAKGVRVQVTRRGEVVAEMQAPATQSVDQTGSPLRFVDLMRERKAWLEQTWGDQPIDIDTTALISEGRDRDFLS